MKNKISYILSFLISTAFLCLTFFVFSRFCLAETSDYNDLLISEIMYDPQGADAGQTDWIEFYNPTSKIISLKKNSFGIIDEKEITLASDKIHYANCHKIDDDFEIYPKSYAILADSKEKFASFYPDIKDVADSTFNFSSDGDFIKLSYDRCATFFIDFYYENSWGGKNNGKTLEKISLDQKYSKDNWQESCVDSGTPGKENSKKSDCIIKEGSNNSKIKLKKDDKIYKNIYANFEIDYLDATEKTKYTWNFGDGHKSYLQKTRHKYEESGIYQGSLNIRGDKKNFQSFTIKVENYSAPKLKIIRLVPNPKGKDLKEFIVIKNSSNKKINLKGWSIATGWKNLVNHPIRENFIINPGKSKKLTKKICAFTLNNSQNKIELRYPDGKIAQKLKYNRKDDTIKDDEIFEAEGKEWIWDNSKANPEIKTTSSEKNIILLKNSTYEENEYLEKDTVDNIKINLSEIQENIGKYSENPSFSAKKQARIKLVGYLTKINTPASLSDYQGEIAGAYTEKETAPKKSWKASITDWIWIQLNSNINSVLNKI